MPIRWPAFPYFRGFPCSSIETAVNVYLEQGQNSCCPGTKVPVKTFPRATRPTPETLTIYLTPNLRGFSTNLLGSFIASMVSRRVGPLYQGHLQDLKTTLVSFQAETGMKDRLGELKPMFINLGSIIYLIQANLYSVSSGEQFHSCLLTQTTNLRMPKVQASRACSMVCPYELIPTLKYSGSQGTTKMATSAWAIPLMVFFMTSLCPGASIMLTVPILVCRRQQWIFMVMPLLFSQRVSIVTCF